jgi:DNA-binding transcriptional LysR family regulator
VSAGLGVTLLPKALLGSLRPNIEVRSHPLPDAEGCVGTVLIRHRDSYAPSALRAFLYHSRPTTRSVAAAE